MKLTATQKSAISRLFSASVLREMATKGRSPLFSRLFSEINFPHRQVNTLRTVGSAFDEAYKLLRKIAARDEYIYRATLIHNILLGRHSLNTASMLTEFRAGFSKADVVILNGTATIYEIKSERDSLSRLTKQISDYQNVFPNIYVIVGRQHIESTIRNTPNHIGVMYLYRPDRIKTVREAVERIDLLRPDVVFDSLRTDEAEEILENLGITLPPTPNTIRRSVLNKYFIDMPAGDIYRQMIQTLKRTRSLLPLKQLIDQLPESLQPAALSTPIPKGDHDRLLEAINTRFNVAIGWR